jgi:hypothetical protein
MNEWLKKTWHVPVVIALLILLALTTSPWQGAGAKSKEQSVAKHRAYAMGLEIGKQEARTNLIFRLKKERAIFVFWSDGNGLSASAMVKNGGKAASI